MEIGTEFVYEVRETVSDRDCVKFSEERYVLKEIDGNDYIFDLFRDGEFIDRVLGKKSYANGHIRNDHMRKVGDITADTSFGKKILVHHSTNMCGGGIEILTDGNIAYQWTEHQMWSGGVIYEKLHVLIRTSLPLRD